MDFCQTIKKLGEKIKAEALIKVIEKALGSQLDEIFSCFLKTDARKCLNESPEMQTIGSFPYIWPKNYKLRGNQSYILCDKVYETTPYYYTDLNETMNFKYCQKLTVEQCKKLIDVLKGQMLIFEYQGIHRRKMHRRNGIFQDIKKNKFIFKYGNKRMKVIQTGLRDIFVVLTPELEQNPDLKKYFGICVAGVAQNLWKLSYGKILIIIYLENYLKILALEKKGISMNKLIPDDIVLKFYDKRAEIPQTCIVDSKLEISLIADVNSNTVKVGIVDLKKAFPVRMFIQGSNGFKAIISHFSENITNTMKKFNFIPKKGIINYELPNFNIDFNGFERLSPKSLNYTLDCLKDIFDKLINSFNQTLNLGIGRNSASLETCLTYNFSRNGNKCEILHFASTLFKFLIHNPIVISIKINSEEPADIFLKEKEKRKLLFYLEDNKLHLVLYLNITKENDKIESIESPHIDYAAVIKENLTNILFNYEQQKLKKAIDSAKFNSLPNINESRPLALIYEDGLNLLQNTFSKVYPDIAAGSIK